MADISKINLSGAVYNIKDATARANLNEIQNISDAEIDEITDFVLESLPSSYVYGYETAAAMQADLDLQTGMIVHTNGFTTSGDGDAAYYTISNSGTIDGSTILALQNGLKAIQISENSSVTTGKIVDSAVTTAKIANNAITADKIASSAADGLRIMSTTHPGVAKVGAGLAMNNDAIELNGGDIAPAVTAWLNAHPEATTTVTDGSISTVKLANNAVTGAKLDKDDGVFSAIFTEIMPTWNTNSGHIKSTDGNVSVNDVFDYTDYTECGDCEYVGIWVNFYATGVGLAFYDKRQRFVSGVEFTFAGSDYNGMDLFRAIPVPEGAVYFRTTRAPYRPIHDEVYGAFKPLRQSIQALQSEAVIPNYLYPQLTATWHDASGHIRPDTGTVSTDTTFGYCDYVACFDYEAIGVYVNFSTSAAGVAFYDESYEYLSGYPFDVGVEGQINFHVIPVPDGAHYFRSTVMSIIDNNKTLYGFMKLLKSSFTCLKDGSGDFDNIVTAVQTACQTMDSTLYIGPGTWDIIEDFGGQSAVESMISSSNRGLYLKNNVHVICSSEALIKCDYQGSNSTTHEWLAAFNAGDYGFTLENARIHTKNCRYCIHDELDTHVPHYKNVYKNCELVHDNDPVNGGGRQVIGGGLGKDGNIVIDGCIFENPSSSGYIVTYHNTWHVDGGRSTIEITNCYFKGGSSARVTYFGNSTEMSKAIIANNSMGIEPILTRETTAQMSVATDIVNMELYAWNNEIRS